LATISSKAEVIVERTGFYLVRRAQASIAGYRHFDDGDLAKFLERDTFLNLADELAEHFFHRSKNLAIYEDVRSMYLVHLIIAPVLQRLPLSAKYDWHRGHLLSCCRVNCGCRRKRYHFSCRTIARSYQPDQLAVNLDLLGIHDAGMVAVLLDLYRRHAGGTAMKDMLAHQLFDPILLMNQKEGHELRYGNTLYRFEKEKFASSLDLRRAPAIVSDFQIRSLAHDGGSHLEIMISDACLSKFRERVKSILNESGNPGYKRKQLEQCVRGFVEQTRYARSGKVQLLDLTKWLGNKLNKLAATSHDIKDVPHLLINLWLQRADHNLHVKAPNFFLDPTLHTKGTYLSFFSPYREV
jgi:hypothetical protein